MIDSSKAKRSLAVATLTVLAGCAGSASHEVVTSYQATDETMSCKQVEVEIFKTQLIIDDINKDKDDISGADVVDTLLWFPFNLIAKNQNYKSALEAADKRMERLSSLKKEKGCPAATTESAQRMKALAEELKKLNSSFKSGELDEEEYKKARAKLLEGIE